MFIVLGDQNVLSSIGAICEYQRRIRWILDMCLPVPRMPGAARILASVVFV
jgi:hypothetical protein